MTLVTTPGDPAADSYASLTDASTYFTARGVASWTGSSTALENALRLGTSYLENQYRDRWVGLTATQAQALSWPRVDGARGNQTGRGLGYAWTYPLYDINGWIIDATTVPVQVMRAAMEAALMALTGVVLEPQFIRGGQVKSLDKQVGPLRKSIVYMDGAPATDRYLVIEGLLRGLVTSNPGSADGNTRLVRA